jgi:hypothetical protein
LRARNHQKASACLPLRIVTCLLPLLATTFHICVTAQEKTQPPSAPASTCSRERALALLEDQIAVTRTFDDDGRRVTVLIRAADVLWPYEQKKARSAFAEAFEAAKRYFREKGDAPARDGKLLIQKPDQRYEVIRAIAKRDSAWARKLTEQLLKEQREDTEAKAKDPRTGEKLLSMASALVRTDPALALGFARSSLQYPATYYLSQFFYELAAVDRPAADQFYQQALSNYAQAPMERLLYLSSYPFGNPREVGEMPGSAYYQVPDRFVPSPNLQRTFVQTILGRAQAFINNPSPSGSTNRLSEPEQMWLALTRLQRQIQESLPELAPAVEAARGNLLALLPEAARQSANQTLAGDDPPKRTFDEQVEAALKNPNVDQRDQRLTSAVLYAAKEETLDRVLEVVDKISDSTIRQPLLNWLYYDRAQRAIKEQHLDEARKFAAKVEELDHRAFLYSRIADESLKQAADQTQMREILEEVIVLAVKAPATPVTARTLFGVAYLYSRFDADRAVGVMGEAIRCINRIENPDLNRQFAIRKIEGKTFGIYASSATPGFNPENAFREIGKVDFDGMLNQASNLSDKSLRAMCILALAEITLKNDDQPVQLKQARPGSRKP